MTEMLNILEEGMSQSINRASEILKRGGIIAYPTDTIYGLGVDPEFPQAVKKLYDLKERREEESKEQYKERLRSTNNHYQTSRPVAQGENSDLHDSH